MALGSPGQCEPGWHRHQPSRPMAERGTPLSVPGQSTLRHVARPPLRAIQSAAGRPPHQPGSAATAATRQTVAVPGTRRLLALRSPCGRSHLGAALSSVPRSFHRDAPRAALFTAAAASVPRSSRPRSPRGRSALWARSAGRSGAGDRRRAEVSPASRGRAAGGGGRRGRLLSRWARPGWRSLCAPWEPDQGRDRGPPLRRASESADGGWRIRGSRSESRVGSASGVRLALLRWGSASESGGPVRVGALSRRSSQGPSEL